jgi:serine/threonine-protein kinase RsbW
MEERMGNADMSDKTPETKPSDKMIELRLPSKLGYERVAMDAASSIAQRMGFELDRVAALKTAISEAVTNAIEHGNQHNETMKVVVLLTVRKDELIVSVTDQGNKTLDHQHVGKIPKIEETFDRSDKGGWGIWLIRELMDEVEFTTAPSGGNQVRMVIHLEQ